MKTVKYSVVKYCYELLEEDIIELSTYKKAGIVVHLFLNTTFEEELILNGMKIDSFKKVLDLKLLFIYENCIDLGEDNTVIAKDGEIFDKVVYEKISKDIKLGFNSEQYNIITADANSNILVVSGAGTGKTTTMINRLIYLRKTVPNFKFENAILITFTNKSSIEMKNRLIDLLEKYYKCTHDSSYLYMMDEVLKCNITTIHVFAKRLINKYGKNIDINKNIEVKSFRFKRINAITEAINKIYKENKNVYEVVKYYPIYELESKILSIWEMLDNYSIDINSKEYSLDFGYDGKGLSEFIRLTIALSQDIVNRNKEESFEVSDLMKIISKKELLSDNSDKYRLIMVDEFQDSDNTQIEFLANFCKVTGSNFLVVGDEKQSIYRFRGAEYTAFHKLKEEIKNLDNDLIEFSMTRNYRTNANLLKEINDIFIDVNKKVSNFRYEEKDYIYSTINSNLSGGIESVNLSNFEDKKDFYSSLRDNKKENENIAVLLRSNADIKEFKEFCDRHQIPCLIEDIGGFYRHEAIRDFYIMIKALIEEVDKGVVYSFLETPYVGDIKLNKKKILSKEDNITINYLKEILMREEWNTYRNEINNSNVLYMIDKIIEEKKPIRSYYEKTLREAKKHQKKYKEIAYVKALEYKLNLDFLVYLLKEKFSDKITSVYQIESFLKIKIATDNTMNPKKPEGNYRNDFIQCLTVHKAKGLEYDYVIMENLNKKLINPYRKVDLILRSKSPSKIEVGYKITLGRDKEEYVNNIYSKFLSDEKEEIIGEEARILYVALTRCKKKLYLNMENGTAATERMNTWKAMISGGIKNV